MDTLCKVVIKFISYLWNINFAKVSPPVLKPHIVNARLHCHTLQHGNSRQLSVFK